jgi:KDO2-lipid IV(A) lauroyltransferase
MSGKPEKKPKLLQWRLEALGHSILEGLAARIPGPWVFHLGEFLGGIAWHLMPSRRQTTVRNLRIAFAGEKSLAEIHQLAPETFRRTGANLMSAAHTARLPAGKLNNAMRIENRELLEQALSEGKGIVLLLAHMGNWEILSRIIHLFPPGTKTGAFYRPLNNPWLDQRVLRRRQLDGTRMFSKRDNPLRVAAFLRDGGVAGVLADQRAGKQGQLVPFFGRLTRVSPLPSLLARRSKATVLAMSLTCEAPGKWVATFHPVAEPQHTPQCMAALETAMKSSPLDVFWLQERWKVYVKPHRPLNQWLDDDSLRGTHPHRILCWLHQNAPADAIPAAWTHPDARYETVREEEIANRDANQVLSWLSALEDSQPLPFDFLLCTRRAPGELAEACKARGIPLVSLDSSQGS